MRFICLLLCLATSLQCQSQSNVECEYRAEYSVDVIMDTTKLVFFHNWAYTLIRKDDLSRFYESNMHFNDSMTTATFVSPPPGASPEEEQEMLNEYMTASFQWKKDYYLGYQVEKNFSTGLTKINAYKILPPTHLEVRPSNFEWNLTGNQDSLFGIAVLQANLNYGGRHWTAWYAPDIPISDGPYSFSGLPGLIVKIVDDRGWYNFELSSFHAGNIECHWGDYFIHHLSHSTSRKKYMQISYDAQNNPKLAGVEEISAEQLLRLKNGAAWKYFMLLERDDEGKKE